MPAGFVACGKLDGIDEESMESLRQSGGEASSEAEGLAQRSAGEELLVKERLLVKWLLVDQN
jgi:hypothetical protein